LKIRSLSSGMFREFNFVTKTLQPLHVITRNPVMIETVKVIGSKFSIRCFVFENVISRREDRMGHCHEGSLFPPATSKPTVLSLKTGVFRMGCSPSYLCQGSLQPAISVPGGAALAFPRAFIVPRIGFRPRGKMSVGREGIHIRSDLGDHVLRRHTVKTRHRDQCVIASWKERATSSMRSLNRSICPSK